MAEAPSSAPLPSLKRAARLARELGLDPATLFTDGDELPSMLFFCRERRRDRWFGIFELLCHVCLVLRPEALPKFVADVIAAKRRSRAMRGEATDSSSSDSDVSSDEASDAEEEGLLFWTGAPAPPAFHARRGRRRPPFRRAAAAPRPRRRRVVARRAAPSPACAPCRGWRRRSVMLGRCVGGILERGKARLWVMSTYAHSRCSSVVTAVCRSSDEDEGSSDEESSGRHSSPAPSCAFS